LRRGRRDRLRRRYWRPHGRGVLRRIAARVVEDAAGTRAAGRRP
jgi:hypothetical protein